MGAITSPAHAAVSANADALYVIRIGGLRSTKCMIAGVAATTSTPASQPKRTIAATPNTNASEMPFASRSSTGTGKRSARSDAPRKAASPAKTVALWDSAPNEIAAATTVARPARQTGATTGARFQRVSADSLIGRPSPLEETSDIDPAQRGRKREQRRHDQQKAKTRLPLRHLDHPLSLARTTRLSLSRPRQPSPGRVIASFSCSSGAEAGFGKRAAGPRKAGLVPARERRERDAVAR